MLIFVWYRKCDELEAKLNTLSNSALNASKGIEETDENASPTEAMQGVEESKSRTVSLGLLKVKRYILTESC